MMPATSSAAGFWPGAYCTVVSPRCWSAALVTWPRANPPPPSWSATWAARPGTVVPLRTATVTSARLTAGPPPEPELWDGRDDSVFGLLAGVLASSPPPKTWVTRRTTSATPATAPRTIPMIRRGSRSPVSASRRSAPRGGAAADGGWRRSGAAVAGRAARRARLGLLGRGPRRRRGGGRGRGGSGPLARRGRGAGGRGGGGHGDGLPRLGGRSGALRRHRRWRPGCGGWSGGGGTAPGAPGGAVRARPPGAPGAARREPAAGAPGLAGSAPGFVTGAAPGGGRGPAGLRRGSGRRRRAARLLGGGCAGPQRLGHDAPLGRCRGGSRGLARPAWRRAPGAPARARARGPPTRAGASPRAPGRSRAAPARRGPGWPRSRRRRRTSRPRSDSESGEDLSMNRCSLGGHSESRALSGRSTARRP